MESNFLAFSLNFFIVCNQFLRVVVQDDRPRTLVEEISKRAAQNPQLIMIAVANNAADRYSAIKKACCCQYGIPSQVVTGRVMDGRNRSKMMSVATVCIVIYSFFR